MTPDSGHLLLDVPTQYYASTSHPHKAFPDLSAASTRVILWVADSGIPMATHPFLANQKVASATTYEDYEDSNSAGLQSKVMEKVVHLPLLLPFGCPGTGVRKDRVRGILALEGVSFVGILLLILQEKMIDREIRLVET